MNTHPHHLSAERIQAFLDGELAAGEAARVQEHLGGCARCRGEVEAWSLLYRELGGLGELTPSVGFADRVMDALPESALRPAPLRERVRGWIGSDERACVWDPEGHLTAAAIQELLDAAVPASEAAPLEEHLDACRACREEMTSWRALMVRLDEVPRLAPSPEFGERVMAHVRVQRAAAVALPGWRERVRGWLDAVSPRTWKRAAALAGASITPAVTLALVAWTVLSHPLVTPGSLLSFVWLKGQSALGALVGALLSAVTSNTVLVQAWGWITQAAQEPLAAAGTLVLLAGLTAGSVWVLYRNLIVQHPSGGRHAHLLS